MTQDLATRYQRVSSAAAELKTTAQAVYRHLQTGLLEGLCVDGSWLVDRRSVAKLRRERERAA
jgi:hypothetical protein